MNYLPKVMGLLATAALLFGCSDRRDVRDYYFPARELVNTEGKVYVYENTGTLPGPDSIYWYYLGVDLDTALYLSITRYGPNFVPQQLSREEITNEGVRLRELTVLQPDTTGAVTGSEMEILFGNTFPFYLDEPAQPAGYRLRGRLTNDEAETTYVTLDRRFRADTTITALGRSHKGIVFDLAGEVSQRSSVEGDISPTFAGFEVYARGIGLVEYQRDLGAAGTVGGRLVRTTPMSLFAEEQKPYGE